MQCSIDVTVVHVVSVESLQLAAALNSFEAGLDRWLSVVSGVRMWSETEITTSSSRAYIFLYIISLLLFKC